MTLQASGTISLNNVNTELGFSGSRASTSISAGEYRDLANQWGLSISLSNFYSKAAPAAYFGGGGVSGNQSTVLAKLKFASQSLSTLSSTLSSARRTTAGFSSSTLGYLAGGLNGTTSGGTYYNQIDGVVFATDTKNDPSATLSNVRGSLAATNNTLYGLIGGGLVKDGSGGTTTKSTIDRYIFSNNTCANIGSTLSLARNDLAGVSNGGTEGVFVGGRTDGGTSQIRGDACNYVTAAMTTLLNALTTGRRGLSGCQYNMGLVGYFFGGLNSAGNVRYSSIETLAMMTWTNAVIGSTLTSARSQTNAANSTDYGYCMSGSANGTTAVSICEVILFGSNTVTSFSNSIFDYGYNGGSFQSGGIL